MSDKEIKGAIDGLGSAFEEFKKTNDARLDAIEKNKGTAELESKLDKINAELDHQGDIKARLEKIETSSAAELSESSKSKGNGAELEYKEAFINFVKKGIEIPQGLEQKALSAASDPDGGYTVTPVMSDRITKAVFETSNMRQAANVQTIGSDSFEILQSTDEATSGGWVSEQASRTTTATPTISKKIIAVHEQYANPKATQRLLDDSSLDAESWLADKVAQILTKTENTAFFTGNGVAKPRGILTYAAGTSWGQIEQISSTSSTGGTLDADDFINLFYALKDEYQANASWFMQRATVKAARKLKENTTNQYIWAPGLQAKAPDTMLGQPITQANDMGVVTTTDALAVACGDFDKGYQIVDRTGIRVLRDPFTDKPFVSFYTTKRVGGDVNNFEAIKLLKMDA